MEWWKPGVLKKKAALPAFQYSNIPAFQYSGRKAAFTLIELLVVLVILVIVTTVSVTSIPSFASPRQKLRTDAREMLSLLQESRRTAMLRKTKVDVWVDPDSGTVRAVEAAWSKKRTAAGDSLFGEEEDLIDTNAYSRIVSFEEDIELSTFPAEAVETVFSSEEDPFSEADSVESAIEERIALSFTHFGGASGGGISLIRENVRLDIACDILTGEPETVRLHSSGGSL